MAGSHSVCVIFWCFNAKNLNYAKETKPETKIFQNFHWYCIVGPLGPTWSKIRRMHVRVGPWATLVVQSLGGLGPLGPPSMQLKDGRHETLPGRVIWGTANTFWESCDNFENFITAPLPYVKYNKALHGLLNDILLIKENWIIRFPSVGCFGPIIYA